MDRLPVRRLVGGGQGIKIGQGPADSSERTSNVPDSATFGARTQRMGLTPGHVDPTLDYAPKHTRFLRVCQVRVRTVRRRLEGGALPGAGLRGRYLASTLIGADQWFGSQATFLPSFGSDVETPPHDRRCGGYRTMRAGAMRADGVRPDRVTLERAVTM